MTTTETEPKPRGAGARAAESHAKSFSPWFFLKLLLVGLVNALGIFLIWTTWSQGRWVIMAISILSLVIVNWVYFSKRPIPLKYLLPGLAFLLVYQIFTIFYTGFVSFTNHGEGHLLSQEQTTERLLRDNEITVPGAESIPLTVMADGENPAQDDLVMAVVLDGQAHIGDAETPFEPVDDAEVSDGVVQSIPGYTPLPNGSETFRARSSEIGSLRVPVSDDPSEGSYRTSDGRNVAIAQSRLEYDEDAETLTNRDTGVVYEADQSVGYYVSEDGERLPIGWRVSVGFDNYTSAFTDGRYAGPFFSVLGWTFVFGFLSVVTTFLFGLVLAIIFNDPRVKGQKIYRTLLIVPYAFPGFLAALLWSGMLNRDYGFINSVILNGAAINWLTDPWLAKFSVLAVNLWLGFPYMFLICTAALQSIPGELKEAAVIDGAGAWNQFRRITLPLVLVSTTPLLISSFAFNFNNFNLIYMLTGGGPRMSGESVNVGHTDILISMVYKIAGLDGSQPPNYGLASALSIMIFIIIAVISIIGFRQSRKMEELV